jgi:hypothetical protein
MIDPFTIALGVFTLEWKCPMNNISWWNTFEYFNTSLLSAGYIPQIVPVPPDLIWNP